MKNKYELFQTVVLNQDVQCKDGVYLNKGTCGNIVEILEIENKTIYLLELDTEDFLLEGFAEDKIDLLEE